MNPANQRQYNRDYYAKTKDRRRKSKQQTLIKVRARNRTFVHDFLKANPCTDCGESDPVVLEFDHRSNKLREVSTLVNAGYSLDKLQTEINKCEVRCANCHRRKTAKERNYFKHVKGNP